MRTGDRGVLKASGRAFEIVDEWMIGGVGPWIERLRFYDDGTVIDVEHSELTGAQREMTEKEMGRYRRLTDEERTRCARPR
jgi:hypothetical protein